MHIDTMRKNIEPSIHFQPTVAREHFVSISASALFHVAAQRTILFANDHKPHCITNWVLANKRRAPFVLFSQSFEWHTILFHLRHKMVMLIKISRFSVGKKHFSLPLLGVEDFRAALTGWQPIRFMTVEKMFSCRKWSYNSILYGPPITILKPVLKWCWCWMTTARVSCMQDHRKVGMQGGDGKWGGGQTGKYLGGRAPVRSWEGGHGSQEHQCMSGSYPFSCPHSLFLTLLCPAPAKCLAQIQDDPLGQQRLASSPYQCFLASGWPPWLPTPPGQKTCILSAGLHRWGIFQVRIELLGLLWEKEYRRWAAKLLHLTNASLPTLPVLPRHRSYRG